MATKTPKIKDFETSLNELETLVKTMESGDLALEESLKTFEQGIKLANSCQSALDQASQKINVLIEENGLQKTVPFESND